ncbi:MULTISPECIES: cytochrome c biogenesis protein DipZ [Pseudomonas]|jgi:cytochrome c biogenesis protein CcdA/thiol-disulfide isomerase/thioredoxin|uniref:Cytochrome c biogenesis protein CcdA n=3 Tax=Pseudomonas fluorescens group TaxID=136843 RepID=A0AB36D0R3_9PSED|nr:MULTISPECIES: cytochrome c biogenesis protein DipZ [Pseudomonas]MDF9879086.1 cytochrome c biogenesis protein CcdA/thiol-disulfide isomerase/thioredoxin [Pseudomonas silensiensis]AHZ71651.1 Redoxin domain protein [Pseudomonas mandelii JR-1]MBA4359642.1 cytochrome c biogenesis protein DipZ [Pseudomonas sp.]MDO8709404.1 cytochrome c biogenesis protein DipZ [Pseudomonas sp.]MDO9328870.1 cytochrome c biogenesis protein DipZ [Pseudomonas sp.]
MWLLVLAYLGGVLTIVSPCILPVLPFVFARTGQPFMKSGLPLLAGMAVTFALVASLAAVGGGWVVQVNQYGRWLALLFVALFGLTLLLPRLAERLTRPLVAAGSRLSEAAGADARPRPGASFLIGVATGLLWAPCAGPILGLLLTGAALQGASIATTLLLLAYAAGAATSLAVALLLGGKVFAAMKRSIGAGEWVRRGLGAAMLAGVAAIALGLDTGILARVSTASTGGLEQALVGRLAGKSPNNSGAMMAAGGAMKMSAKAPGALPIEGNLPPLDGAVQWLNSPPLTAQALKGKVVLVDFWTYSCINCLRTLPYVKAWAEKYRDQGLVVIGVHAPEFAFERDVGNVTKAMKDLGINYPVAIDNDYKIWRAFNNEYWPAHYFADAQGRIRYHHFGEGEYAESERVIQQLLREAGASKVADGLITADATGVQLAPDMNEVQSPETYVGYQRAEHFVPQTGLVPDKVSAYSTPAQLALNDWGLDGQWNVGSERAISSAPASRIVYRFHARDLHLVLGPGADGKPVRFKVLIDGKAPGDAHGTDVAPDGSGSVTEQRLYQLVRQNGGVTDRTFSIEFLDPGVSAYAFTFG